MVQRDLMGSAFAYELPRCDQDSGRAAALWPQVRLPDHILRVKCFGDFCIAGTYGWEHGPQPKRGRELLQYLVLHPNRAVSSERLRQTFWPEIDAECVSHRLHVAASGARSFLRHILDGFDAIRCAAAAYSLHPAVYVQCDIAKFAELYRDGSNDALKDAVALYEGELFQGEADDWLEPARVKYATMYASMLERLANSAFTDGNFEASLDYGLELLSIDRAHEGASRLVMRCFAAVGRRGQALAEYQTLSAFLLKHLAITPMAETTCLIHSIMQP